MGGRLQLLAELGHAHRERLARTRGSRLAPEQVDQPVCRDRLARMQQQDRQQCPLARAAERDRLALRVDLERSQDAKVQTPRLAANVARVGARAQQRCALATRCPRVAAA
jgi:hypothetical protein